MTGSNLEAATEAIDGRSHFVAGDGIPAIRLASGQDYAAAALNAIDPRLKDLTPEDVKAILDYMRTAANWQPPTIPTHVWEILR
jgi:hypothetical protein